MVRILEPGRIPLYLAVRQPVDVGRDCDGLLLADSELSRRHLRLSSTRAARRSGPGQHERDVDRRRRDRRLPGPQANQVVTFGHCRLEMAVDDDLRSEPGIDPLRRTGIDIVADAAVAEPMPAGLPAGGTLTIVFSDINQSTRRPGHWETRRGCAC